MGDKKSHQEAIEAIYVGRLEMRKDGFYEIPPDAFVNKIDLKMPDLPPIDFYSDKTGKVELLKEKDQSYSALALSNLPYVLIKEEDFKTLQKFAEARIIAPTTNQPLPVDKRMETLRRKAIVTVEDLFNDPSPENIKKSNKVVGSFVYLLMKEPEAFLVLSQLSSHDPYTLQHSVGTAVNSIILGRKMGINEEKDLEELGMGGLLHDIGKVHVKKEIINKDGPLDELEWEEMRQHSEMGYEIIKDNPDLAEATKLAVIQHHEDKSGTGYPDGTPWEDVHPFAKIVAISDVFNALTTNRSYSDARTPFEAFQLMRDKIMNKLDDDMFEQLVLVYGGKLPK